MDQEIYAAGDANQSDESGYTKLEIYLNSLCHNRSSIHDAGPLVSAFAMKRSWGICTSFLGATIPAGSARQSLVLEFVLTTILMFVMVHRPRSRGAPELRGGEVVMVVERCSCVDCGVNAAGG